mgnify:CR=1 FL=1
MKRLLSMVMAAAMALSLVACGGTTASGSTASSQAASSAPASSQAESVPASSAVSASEDTAASGDAMRIAGLQGPTTMGMVKLMKDQESMESPLYDVIMYGAADEIVPLLTKGELDAAAIPANLAATLYQKTEGKIQVAAVNTLGVLYVVTTGDDVASVADLAGKTVYIPLQSSPPDALTQYFLNEAGLTVGEDVEIVYASTAEVAALLASGEAEYATLIEPQVTSAMSQNSEVRRALSFEEEWQRVTGTDTMIPNAGFGTTQGFIDENPELTEQFQAAYAESVQWVLDHPAEAAALAEEHLGMKAAVVEAAIPNMGLTFKSAQDAWGELDTFYNLLNDFDPSMIGGKLPNDGLYYAG